jgi:RNA polymerase sigma factor (sigma-70 family)
MDASHPTAHSWGGIWVRQVRRFDLKPQGIVHVRLSGSEEDRSLAGFEELALPLFDSLYNLARWLARNQCEAEDLVQETYLKAFRGYKSFKPGTHFRAWMFQILRNTFLTSCSKLERRLTDAFDSEEDLPVEPATPESLLIAHSGVGAIRAAIEQLPLALREVILLCDVEDASYREIAEILSIPIGTVMSRLARARKAVRESLRSTTAPGLGGLHHPSPISRTEYCPCGNVAELYAHHC